MKTAWMHKALSEQHLNLANAAIIKLGKATNRADYERASELLTTVRAEITAARTEAASARETAKQAAEQGSDIERARLLDDLDAIEHRIDAAALKIGDFTPPNAH